MRFILKGGQLIDIDKTPVVAPVKHKGLLDHTVSFKRDDVEVCGKVKKINADGTVEVALGIPDSKGVLLVSDTRITLKESEVAPYEIASLERKIKRWTGCERAEFDKQDKFLEVKDGQLIKDYHNVGIKGYGSTFAAFTHSDRDGDRVAPTAFDETLAEFKSNPIMLYDHRNSVRNIAGSYTKVTTDAKGLYLEGMVSNAPDLQFLRFLIAEGHLKTLSMGGICLYGDDGYLIEKVYLFEVSLVAIPANQDALFVPKYGHIETSPLEIEAVVKRFKQLKAA